MKEPEFIIIVTTTQNGEEARFLGRTLLEARLAACVQISTVESHYRWEGKLQRQEEYRLEAKSRRDLFEQARDLICAHHSYDLPEILSLPLLETSAEYASWLREALKEPPR